MPDAIAIERSEIRSDNPNQADAALADRFVGFRLRARQDDRPFRFVLARVDAGELRVDYLRHSMTADARMDRLDHFMVGTMLNGRAAMRTWDEEIRALRGDTYLLPAGREPNCSWENFGRTLVHVPLQAVEQLAEEVGAQPGTVRFDSMVPVSAAMNRHWRSLLCFVVGQLNDRDIRDVSDLLTAEFTRMLAASVLVVFPNTIMSTAYVAGPGTVCSSAVRRATEFIEANVTRPVTTCDVARAARVSARALQAAFRREFDLTPQQYLRRVRLEAAYRDLTEADPSTGVSVRSIAARWGFTSPARFARVYYDRFGVPPSRTLHS